jgi:hypothetical protein
MFDVILPIAGVWVNLAIVAGIGLLIGVISGLFGVGGGFLMTPLLIFLGVPPTIAVATGSAQLVAAASFGTASAWRAKLIDNRLTLYLLIGAMIGTIIGIGVFNLLSNAGHFDIFVGWSYVILLGSVGSLMLKESLKAFKGNSPNTDEGPASNRVQLWLSQLGAQRYFPKFDISISVPPLLILSIIIGMIGSVLGVGGGFMFVPALIYLFHLPTRAAVAASQVQIFFTMFIATVLHAVYNHAIDLVLAVPLIFGGVVGAHLGTIAGLYIKGVRFRLALALLIFGVALRFLFSLIMTFVGNKSEAISEKISLSALPVWEGWIALAAQDNTLLYGIATALLAICSGFGAALIFKKK